MAEHGAARYRHYAAHCVEIAREMSDPDSRARLRAMAQAWLLLAGQADRNSAAPTLIYETSSRQPIQQQQQQQPPPPGKDRG
jgi:hypothetical protein